MVIAINLKFKADDSRRKALEKEKIAVSKSIIAEEKKKEAVSNKRIAEQQQSIAEEQRLISEKNKQYAVEQQRQALYQKRLALIAKHDAERARDIAKELQIKAEQLRDTALKQKQMAEEQRIRAEQSEAYTDTLRRLAVAKSLAIAAVKKYSDNKKSQKLTDYEVSLPKILALQAYYFNKKFKGNPNDADVFAALSEVSESAKILRGKEIHTDGIRQIAVSGNGKYFITCSDDGSAKIFETENPQNKKVLNIPFVNKDEIRCVDIDYTGEVVVAGTYSGNVLLWKNLKLNNKPEILKLHSSVVNAVKLSSDYKYFYTVSNDGTLKKQALNESSDNSSVIYQTGKKILSLALSPDNKKLAAGTSAGDIIIFTSGNYADKIIIPDTKHQRVMSLCMKDENTLFAGYSSGMLKIIKNGKIINEFYAHISGVSAVVYDKNTNRLITGSYDGLIKIRDYNNLKLEPIVLSNHSSWVYTVALSPDGKKVYSGGVDKEIVINSVDVEELKSALRKKVSENMIENDWIRYVGKGIKYDSELPNF